MFQVTTVSVAINRIKIGVHFILDTAPIVRNPRFVGSPVLRVPKIGLALGTMTMTYYENSDASDLEEIDDNDKTKTKTMITMMMMITMTMTMTMMMMMMMMRMAMIAMR